MIDFFERLDIYLDYKGLNDNKVTLEAGLSNGIIGKARKRGSLSQDNISKILYTYIDLDANWLFTGKGNMTKNLNEVEKWLEEEKEIPNNILIEPNSNVFKLKTDELIEKQSVPLYDIQASASVIALFKDQNGEKPIDHITIPNLPKCDGAIYVSGDSMYPLLKSGDIIMYKKVENALDAIFWGEMYLVSIINDYGDEFVMIKWLQRSDQGKDFVKLVSENRHHQPTEFHIKNIKGLALIKASVRINSMY